MQSGDYWSDSATHVPSVVQAATASTRLSWSTDVELSYEDWLADGALFDEYDPGWAIGDWLTYGVAHFGNCYGAAAMRTGIARQTLKQMAQIAAQFAPARRREELPLEVHGVVAELDADAQEEWLDRASEEGLNYRQLRALLNAAQREWLQDRYIAERRRHVDRRGGVERRAQSLNPYGDAPTEDRVVMCPHCGEQFAA
jgi:hypothetical protein